MEIENFPGDLPTLQLIPQNIISYRLEDVISKSISIVLISLKGNSLLSRWVGDLQINPSGQYSVLLHQQGLPENLKDLRNISLGRDSNHIEEFFQPAFPIGLVKNDPHNGLFFIEYFAKKCSQNRNPTVSALLVDVKDILSYEVIGRYL